MTSPAFTGDDQPPATPMLRLPPEEQGEFEFLKRTNQALAVPKEDVLLWMGRRKPLEQPAYVAVKLDLKDDPRWEPLLRASEEQHMSAEYVLMVMAMTACAAMRQPTQGLLARRGHAVTAAAIRRMWGMPAEGLEDFGRALRVLIATGWLLLRDIETDKTAEIHAARIAGKLRARQMELPASAELLLSDTWLRAKRAGAMAQFTAALDEHKEWRPLMLALIRIGVV